MAASVQDVKLVKTSQHVSFRCFRRRGFAEPDATLKQRKPRINIRRILRKQLLHARIQLFDRAFTLKSRFETVCFLQGFGDVVDVLLVAQDYASSAEVTVNGLQNGRGEELTSLKTNKARVQRVHDLHRVFGRVLAELELCVIQGVVAGDAARDPRFIASVGEGFLSVHHEVVVAQVSADHDIQAGDEFGQD